MGNVSRRGFLGSASAGLGTTLGAAALGVSSSGVRAAEPAQPGKLPREVWVASVTQRELWADSHEQMVEMLFGRMAEVVTMRPDIICLPELAPFLHIVKNRPPVRQVVEELADPLFEKMAGFAREHNCYVWYPVYTLENGHYYNSLVLINRAGEREGQYHKIHATPGEMEMGVSPGPLKQPVIVTDFGRVGAQICFDLEWDDGWLELESAGAELVFWASAFGGGNRVNFKAGRHHYHVVASTGKGISKLCDITGETIAWTGLWQEWMCARVNLEKALVHCWPYSQKFGELRNKYGPAVEITIHHDEELAVIESLHPEVKVAEVLREFGIKTSSEHLADAARLQREKRG